MVDDQILLTYAEQLGEALAEKGLMLASAESCTGGWIGQAVTAVAGSSAWYDRGFITYSNHAKQQMLGVQPATLTQYGAASEQTAQEMAAGAIKMSDAQLAVAVTGIAGPTGGSKEKPVGMVCFAWASKQGLARSETHFFSGDREAVRRQAVGAALLGIIKLLENMPPSLA
ncbi:nicotinamide-nucleotide amidohydrolase family protein [Nitrosomonas sp. Is37]|uniref:CinA family protein n=1 Tax=Nitrosomonas sp. Is37 TaxID=3080535 RepID=UPI00294AC69B|nr:nicotinamide-nucleotide amidohydrolase family protein [Nitrosomonas sp. Is37]MDV6343105.1 nicotinamide-nucleotide amidohydrolase family protein [Nitrosomonas sp. Is37]